MRNVSVRPERRWLTMVPGIIVNVASGFVSFELMPPFYQYGYAFPFFNSVSFQVLAAFDLAACPEIITHGLHRFKVRGPSSLGRTITSGETLAS